MTSANLGRKILAEWIEKLVRNKNLLNSKTFIWGLDENASNFVIDYVESIYKLYDEIT